MRLKPAWICLLCLFAFAAEAAEYGIFIQQASITRVEDQGILNADVDYALTPSSISALENGVSLTLLLEFSLQLARPFWLNETVISEQRRIQLRYQPLAKSYQIADLASGVVQNYASLSSVMDTLQRIRGWRIPGAGELDPDPSYVGRLRFRLDIESLPLPLRAVAYTSPDWRLDCPIYEWPVKL